MKTISATGLAISLSLTGLVTTPTSVAAQQILKMPGATPQPETAMPGGTGTFLIAGGIAVGLALALGAGGGDDEGQRAPAPPPDIDPGTPPETDRSPQDFETLEYRRNYGLGMIGASYRYAEGGTGWNQLLAVFDTGADIDRADLSPNVISDLSYSYFTGDSDVRDFDGHGTHVATTMAAARDGRGAHGVAFDSKLMILQGLSRPDGDPSTFQPSITAALADAQVRAANAGARAINHSWTFTDEEGRGRLITEFNRVTLGTYLGSNVMNSIAYAHANDLVTVIATGNDSADQVSNLAGLAAYYPEYKGTWVAVTAVDSTGTIADFANKCGIAKDFCIAAPGVYILAGGSSDAGYTQDGSFYSSGTSMAAPHYTGSVGVMGSNFPELTGEEIVTILFDTAFDAGIAGTDEVYGRGILDMSNAIAPQGLLSIESSQIRGAGRAAVSDSWIAAEGGIGQGLAASLTGTDLMISDKYDRGYSADLGAMVAQRDASSSLASKLSSVGSNQQNILHFGDVEMGNDELWADPSGLSSPYTQIGGIETTRIKHGAGTFDFTIETGFEDSIASYGAAQITAKTDSGRYSAEMGMLSEDGQLLGSQITGAFGGDITSTTRFMRLGGEFDLSNQSSLHLSASAGRTGFSSSGILRNGTINSSQVGIGLSTKGVLQSNDGLTLGISRPLSISDGSVQVERPVAYAQAQDGVRSDVVLRQATNIDLQADESIYDIQVGYSAPIARGTINLGALYRTGGIGAHGSAVKAEWAIKF